MAHEALHLGDLLAGVALIPVPVQMLGNDPELNDEIARKILRLDLATLLAPQAQQRGLILPYDDPSVRAAKEGASIATLPRNLCNAKSLVRLLIEKSVAL